MNALVVKLGTAMGKTAGTIATGTLSCVAANLILAGLQTYVFDPIAEKRAEKKAMKTYVDARMDREMRKAELLKAAELD